MKRVLIVFGEPISNGGQEVFIMNIYKKIDKKKIQFDFYTPFFCDNNDMKNQVIKMGGKVFVDNGRFGYEGSKMDYVRNLKRFLNIHKYDIVHINSGSVFALAVGSKIAYKSGAKRIIVHSHCAGIDNLKHKISKFIFSFYFKKYPTDFWACSNLAAKFKFPKSIINKKKYKVIKNGIEIEKFKYNENIRKKIRLKLNIENNYVIGHIGRFTPQKNHSFIIDVFKYVHSKDKSAKLLLIGSGPMEDEIKQKVLDNDLNSDVIFMGVQKNTDELYQAMDVFLFPSIFEGLGIVLVEAQVSGLNCLVSTEVPIEAKLTDVIKYKNLSETVEKWGNEILEMRNSKREDLSFAIQKNGYNISSVAENVENDYLKEFD